MPKSHAATDSAPAAAGQAAAGAVDALALERQVCFALSVASRGVVQAYRPVLEPLGLSHPQYLVMLSLWAASPKSLGALASELRLEAATLSPLVRRLEAAGLVARTRNSCDGRMLDIALTDAGQRLRERALSVPTTMVERLGLSKEQLLQLHSLMTTLIAAADAAGSP